MDWGISKHGVRSSSFIMDGSFRVGASFPFWARQVKHLKKKANVNADWKKMRVGLLAHPILGVQYSGDRMQ